MAHNVSVITPSNLPPEIAEYLIRLTTEINIAVSKAQQCEVMTALPLRPIEGKIYYFKNAIATTPITSAGYWGYGTSWTKLS